MGSQVSVQQINIRLEFHRAPKQYPRVQTPWAIDKKTKSYCSTNLHVALDTHFIVGYVFKYITQI